MVKKLLLFPIISLIHYMPVIWLRNRESVWSINGTEHFHVILYDLPAKFSERITGNDKPYFVTGMTSCPPTALFPTTMDSTTGTVCSAACTILGAAVAIVTD
jgi:hypothetical protein